MAALDRVAARAASGGGELAVLLMPTKEDIYPPTIGMDEPSAVTPFALALEEKGISHLDLTTALRAAAEAGERLFHRVDGHPNEQGYGVIADTVRDFLRAHCPACLTTAPAVRIERFS